MNDKTNMDTPECFGEVFLFPGVTDLIIMTGFPSVVIEQMEDGLGTRTKED